MPRPAPLKAEGERACRGDRGGVGRGDECLTRMRMSDQYGLDSFFAVLSVSSCCLVLSRLALFLFLCETFSRQKGETRARQGKTTGTERSGDRNAEQGARVRGRPGGAGSGN